jgi:hypothetical protein
MQNGSFCPFLGSLKGQLSELSRFLFARATGGVLFINWSSSNEWGSIFLTLCADQRKQPANGEPEFSDCNQRLSESPKKLGLDIARLGAGRAIATIRKTSSRRDASSANCNGGVVDCRSDVARVIFL